MDQSAPLAQSNHWKKGVGILIAACAMGALYFSLNLGAPTPPSTGQLSLQLSEGGRAVDQFGTLIAKAVPQENGGSQLRVYADRGGLDGSLSLKLNLPKPLDPSEFSGRIESIQGTAGMSVYLLDPTTVNASIIQSSPDSRTVIILDLPPGYLRFSPLVSLTNLLYNASLATWLAIAGSAIIGCAVVLLVKSHRLLIRTREASPLPPEGLDPAELSLLLDGRLTPHAIAATIYRLGERELLQVIDNGSDVFFLRTSKNIPLEPYEEAILSFLAPRRDRPRSLAVILGNLSEKLFSTFASIVTMAVYQRLQQRGGFTKDMRAAHLKAKTIGIFLQLFGFLVIITPYLQGARLPAGLFLMGLTLYALGQIIFYFRHVMLPYSNEGLELALKAQRFRNYLVSSQPITIHGVGDEFYRLLPYALALNVSDQWFARFVNATFEVPSWLSVTQSDLTEPTLFLDSFHHITDLFANPFLKVKDPNVD